MAARLGCQPVESDAIYLFVFCYNWVKFAKVSEATGYRSMEPRARLPAVREQLRRMD